MSDKEKVLQELSDMSQLMEDAKLRQESKINSWWNNLTEQEREWAFYAVVQRIFQGDITEKGSYRYVLYNIFKFDPGMYGAGMDCGYMYIHNALWDGEKYQSMSQATRIEFLEGESVLFSRELSKSREKFERLKFDYDSETQTLKVSVNGDIDG